ncbi:MAG: autotransporter domain-containing protein, partial [Betaproteobacteria bacterium]
MKKAPDASSGQRLFLQAAAIVLSTLLVAEKAYAECGGLQECIAISINSAVAPFHSLDGINRPAPTIDFGNQIAATTSASRTIFVAGVSGPAGTRATLNSISLSGANAGDFMITGGTCTPGTPTLLHDGAQTAQISNACTITVAFRPAAVGVKNAQVDIVTAAITRVAPLTGTGTPSPTGPGAAAASLTVQVNSSGTLDLAPFITGPVTGVAIVSAPGHGSATASGTSVTYTPAQDYFGPDTFAYAAFNAFGSSAPAVVTVTVADRPDPSKNANVIGLLSAQTRAARRFSRAQISNFQRRMESLHRGAAPAGEARAQLGVHPSTSSARTVDAMGVHASTVPARTVDAMGVHASTGPARTDANPFMLSGADAKSKHDGLGSLMLSTLSAASNQSLALSYSTNGSGSGTSADTGLWIGGNLTFGTREPTNDGSSMRFRTDGVSLGIDHRFSDRLALGLGVGYAHDRTDIGTEGTQSRSSGASVALYGSYQPTPNTFIDGLIGYGDLKHDTDRYVAAVDDFARADRRSDQFFASLAAGYEFRRNGVLLSPYGRLDYALDRFKQATETGAGLNALTYFDQDVRTLQLALGLRAESGHSTGFGWVMPR